MTYLRASEFEFWSRCPGQPSRVTEDAGRSPKPDVTAAEQRKNALEATGARVALLVGVRLDVGTVTAERHGTGVCDAILLVTYDNHDELEVWHEGTEAERRLYALCALLKYELLHTFTAVRIGETVVDIDELYVFGQKVTEAASLALKCADDPMYVTGEHCLSCRAAPTCPAHQRQLAESLV